MFEHLDSIRPDLKPMFDGLKKADASELAEEKNKHSGCPQAYWQFLLERGSGALEQDGEPFAFEARLLSAEKEYFFDRQIYDNGANGDIMIFGSESMGTAYGFDTGDGWQLVEVDEFRVVTKLEMNFEQFVTGLVLCYPQIPTCVRNGQWVDGVGTRYTIA